MLLSFTLLLQKNTIRGLIFFFRMVSHAISTFWLFTTTFVHSLIYSITMLWRTRKTKVPVVTEFYLHLPLLHTKSVSFICLSVFLHQPLGFGICFISLLFSQGLVILQEIYMFFIFFPGHKFPLFSNYSQQEWPTIDENWIYKQENFYSSRNYDTWEYSTRGSSCCSEDVVSHNQN